jgi:Uma2 family endonuclease
MYWQATPTVDLGDNVTVRLDLDNEPQPDAVLRLVQGSSRVSEDGFIEGSPELITEIAASSASYDLHEKKRVYQRNSIREYIVWRVLDEEVDWFELSKDRYTLLKPDPEGVIKSPFFTGLWLNVPALLAGNLTSVLATLQKGLASADLA